MTSPRPTRYGLDRTELAALLDGQPRYRLDRRRPHGHPHLIR